VLQKKMVKEKAGKKAGKGGGKGGEKERKRSVPNVQWVCLECEEEIDEDVQDSIECGVCKKWCHKSCSQLKDERYRYLQNSGGEVLWGCQKCRDPAEKDTGSTRLEAKVDSIMQMMTKLVTRLVELEEERSKSKIEERIDETVERKVAEAMDESREREKRKMNVVFVNVQESEGETAEERKKRDIEKVVELVGKISDVGREEISDPVRLGGRTIGSESRPRMLRVTVRTEEAKKKVLMNARKLSEGKDARNRVYVNQDRTPKEREDFRKMRDELERRKKEDPELVIRGGKIVKKRDGDQSRRGEGTQRGVENKQKE